MKETSPVSAMATPTNGSGNLVDEFEETFQYCLNVLTKEEAVSVAEKEEIKVEVEHTTFRFIDLARQMEAFFLQKRFLLSALKPEMVLKEDISELRLELARKEEILKRHSEKIAVWQNMLSDLKSYNKNSVHGTNESAGSTGDISPIGGDMPGNPNSKCIMGMSTAMHQLQQEQFHQQIHQQQLQQMQQQQLQLQQHMQLPLGIQSGVNQGMVSPEVILMQQSGLQSPRVPFSQQGPGRVMQGPLAYLEKTTSNIGLTDGRR